MLKKIFIRSSIGLLVATSLLFGYYFYFKYSFVEDLNYRSSVAETALGSIEYSLTGESDLVLLVIHGTPGGHDQTIEPSSYYRVLTPSRPGYIRTPLSVGKSPAEQAKAYKALLDSLGIKEVMILGFSGGGPAAIEFAAAYPETTLGFIALAAISHSEESWQRDDYEDEAFLNGSDFGLWFNFMLLEFLGDEAFVSFMLPNPINQQKLLKNPKQLENLKKTIWSIWPLSIRKEGFINDYLQESNLSLHLTDIKVPTLVIHGTGDILVDISQGEAIARLVPNATMYVVEGGGHMMMSTHSEEIEEIIENFFQKTVDYIDFIREPK